MPLPPPLPSDKRCWSGDDKPAVTVLLWSESWIPDYFEAPYTDQCPHCRCPHTPHHCVLHQVCSAPRFSFDRADLDEAKYIVFSIPEWSTIGDGSEDPAALKYFAGGRPFHLPGIYSILL